MGHDPMIWSPSADHDPVAGTTTTTKTKRTTMRSTGALRLDFDVRSALTPRELVSDNDGVLLLALPANGHRRVMDRLAPEIVDRILPPSDAAGGGVGGAMHVIISSHASLGAVYFMGLLREECRRRITRRRTYEDDRDDDRGEGGEVVDEILRGVRITAWGTTVVTARKTSEVSVHVPTVRRLVDYCTVPPSPPPQSTPPPASSSSSKGGGDVRYAWGREKTMSSRIKTTTITATHTMDVATSTAVRDTASAATSTTKRESLLRDDDHDLCTALFGPRFRRRDGGLLAISLSNLNPQNHLGIVLGNMSRMDPPPPPPPLHPPGEPSLTLSSSPSSSPWPSWYQGENVTPNVGRLMEALDRERLDIVRSLGVDVRTIHEHFSWSFDVPMETPVGKNDNGEEEDVDDEVPASASAANTTSNMTSRRKATRPLTVSEMNQMMHHHLNNDVLGPATPNTRYVLEDVPYGLVPTVLLGRAVGRPAILHESGIRILSAMYGRDFMAENDLLQGLGLLTVDSDHADRRDDDDDITPTLERWRKMAYSGSL
ncbi:hypothetical protein ACHAW5_001706 [Stephanodiscus triporus]|uniref:Opine dehydrogenase domain-containing protein n=1 Tax=Stephanodiscus triporus TaxID=2934178 RepID=A0ABD3MZC8_9STRA